MSNSTQPLGTPKLFKSLIVCSPDTKDEIIEKLSRLCDPCAELNVHYPRRVMVSCSPTTDFYGAHDKHAPVSMPLTMFIRHYLYFGSAEDPMRAEASTTNYYLSQCRIFADSAPIIPELCDIFAATPPINVLLHHRQTNIWMSPGPTITSTHYDDEDNLLLVVRGCKLVAVKPPACPDSVLSHPLHHCDAHHSDIDVPTAPSSWWEKEADTEALIKSLTEAGWQCFVLHAGDGLFLPQGWWHRVWSSPGTIAVNYWGSGYLDEVVQGPAAPYAFRKICKGLATQQVQERLRCCRAQAIALIAETGAGAYACEVAEPGKNRMSLLDARLATFDGYDALRLCVEVARADASSLHSMQIETFAMLHQTWSELDSPTDEGDKPAETLFAELADLVDPSWYTALESAYSTLLEEAIKEVVLHLIGCKL